jgi:ELWxxDGT repeat protein
MHTFVNLDDQILFNMDGKTWRTDGTASGTEPLSPPGVGTMHFLDEIGSDLYFLAGDTVGLGLWRFDRTSGEGEAVFHFRFGPSLPPYAAAVGDKLYLSAGGETHGVELWESDGTARGTRLVSDIAPGAASSQPSRLLTAGRRVFFGATNPSLGTELYAYTPARQHLTVVHDVPGTLDSYPKPAIHFNGELLFTARKSDGTFSLLRTGGTSAATVELNADISLNSMQDVIFDGKIFMITQGLWRSDGTATGTVRIDGPPTQSSYPGYDWISRLMLAHNRLYYIETHGGYPYPIATLRALDKSTSEPRDVGLSAPDIRGPYVSDDGRIFFMTVNYAPFTPRYYELKASGPVQLDAPFGSLPAYQLPGESFGNSITIGQTRFYGFDDGVHGAELWMDDGETQRMVADLYEGPLGSGSDGLAYVNGHLVFSATTREHGREMFTLHVRSTIGPGRPTLGGATPASSRRAFDIVFDAEVT